MNIATVNMKLFGNWSYTECIKKPHDTSNGLGGALTTYFKTSLTENNHFCYIGILVDLCIIDTIGRQLLLITIGRR